MPHQFTPSRIYFEPGSANYPLGQELLKRYRAANVPLFEIESHNSIKELQQSPNSEFGRLKSYLILGVRKTHKYVPNQKTSDFLVPFTSSGCTAMCLYCYLVCNYNKCAYMRIFVNREEMLAKLIKTSLESGRELTFEIGSNSDLILENTITGNLPVVVEQFGRLEKGFLTLPTKFDLIDPLLDLDHKGRTIIRMSVNPEEIIKKVEFGTSRLKERINAINSLADAGYKVGLLIAPVVFMEDWQKKYHELIETLSGALNERVKRSAFFEVIFMTYSYVHQAINTEAFPNAVDLLDKRIMTGKGRGKYSYNNQTRLEGETFFRAELQKYFKNNEIAYIV